MLETAPLQPVVFPPAGGTPYKVKTGDNWISVATANSVDTWDLIEFNFPVVKGVADFQLKCRQVNWLLRNHIGCRQSSDGKNYRFDSSDSPGVIYLPGPAFTHRVRLHFRSIALTTVPFETLLSNAQKVYAQYGIRIDFASGMSLGLSEDEAKKYETVDGSCKWEITSGEYNEIHNLGGSIPANEIAVFYVNRFSSGKLGCGGHAPGKPACIVTAAGSQWTTAHEVGHVLLGRSFSPVHETSTDNLMYKNSPSITGNPPSLTDEQVEQIKKSPYCIAL